MATPRRQGVVPAGASSARVRAQRAQAARARTARVRARRRTVAFGLVAGVVVLGLWAVISRRSTPGSDAAGGGGVALDAGAFSPGACESFAPTSGDRHRTVFLDAGHGGLDPGAVGTTSGGSTIYEADETLPVELDTARLLRARGYQVVLSRTTDSSVVRLTAADRSGGVLSLQGAHDDVAARDVCANLAHADVLVGIYFDSGSSTGNAGSLTTYDTARPFQTDNLRLADLLQQAVLASMNAHGWGIPNAGVLSDATEGSLVQTSSSSALATDAANYGHLLLLGPAMAGYFSTPSQMPGAVIEPLFVTDPFEATVAASAQGQQAIAQGLADAIGQYLFPPRPHPAG